MRYLKKFPWPPCAFSAHHYHYRFSNAGLKHGNIRLSLFVMLTTFLLWIFGNSMSGARTLIPNLIPCAVHQDLHAWPFIYHLFKNEIFNRERDDVEIWEERSLQRHDRELLVFNIPIEWIYNNNRHHWLLYHHQSNTSFFPSSSSSTSLHSSHSILPLRSKSWRNSHCLRDGFIHDRHLMRVADFFSSHFYWMSDDARSSAQIYLCM